RNSLRIRREPDRLRGRVLHLHEGDVRRHYGDTAPLGVGEPCQTTGLHGAFDLLLEIFGAVDLQLDELVGLSDADANFHEPPNRLAGIVTPFRGSAIRPMFGPWDGTPFVSSC